MSAANRKLELQTVACGVCESSRSAPVTSGADYEYSTAPDEFHVVECLDCGNWYLNPRPTNRELPTIYPPNYYAYNYDEAVHPLARRAKDFLDRQKIKGWLKHLATSAPTFLDVGCGDGRYLRVLHERFNVSKNQLYGVEMSAKNIGRLNAEGYRGFDGRIEDAATELPAASFDLIVSLQVLEHVETPFEAMRAMANLLKPGGVLIIETPNTRGLDARIFKNKYWGGYHFPRHWNLFNRRALEILADKSGLEIKKFNFLPAHSFWIFSFHHRLAGKMPGAAKWFNPLRNVPLLALFTAFDMAQAAIGLETSNVQMIAQKPQ